MNPVHYFARLSTTARIYAGVSGLIAAWLVFSHNAGAGELKVDINRDSKNSDANTEAGYTKWSQDTTGGAATGTNSATKSFTSLTGEAISVSFSQTPTSLARGGAGLLTDSYTAGLLVARLISDGFTVNPKSLSTGGQSK